MIFERFEDDGLSQYSYAVGCAEAGEVAIVDPRRDVDVYLRFAHDQEVAIRHVLETHIHADFASGARELAERTGAALWVSAHDAGEAFEVAFPHRDLADGDEVRLGAVRLAALHTPGHTPEHLSFLVYDGARSAEVPELLLSGDFLFVGSLGRPDLLGEEAKRALANRLFDSVRGPLAALPDGLEVHPGHGAGSMCGSGMSGRPMSTLGYERATNPYLDPSLTRERFVERILDGVPPFPAYYRRMKRLNSEGPPRLDRLPVGEPLAPEAFRRLARDGATVVDLRDHLAFGGGHVPGSFGIGGDERLSTWAAWVVPYDRPILLVPESAGESAGHAAAEVEAAEVEAAARRLVRVGLDPVAGWLDGGLRAWREAGLPLCGIHQVGPRELAARRDAGEDFTVLDVREADEWAEGHVEGALHVPAGELQERLDEIPDGARAVAVICGSGYRSTVAASVLERNGWEELWNVTGGMTAWNNAGLPVVKPAS